MSSGPPTDRSQLKLVGRLAIKDYRHEWVMSGCQILALAAVLLPLLVLFGLKTGIISNLLSPLKEDPRYREIVPSSSGRYTTDFFNTMSARSDVQFVVPRTRSIAATIKLQATQSTVGRIIDVELIPSGTGDPALGDQAELVSGYEQVVLSADLAQKLGVAVGAELEGIVGRVMRDESQSQKIPLITSGIANNAAFSRDGLFVSVDLLTAIEDYRDGRAVAALGWQGMTAQLAERDYAGFRLYARSLDDVAALHNELLRLGVDVRSRVADIELVNKLDRNLGIVFWIIAILAIGGFFVSFASNIWANVDRKRRDFSVLRLTGFRTNAIVWFPIVQAGLTALAGWLIAVALFFLVQSGLNALFESSLGAGQAICHVRPLHFLITLVLTTLIAAGAAAIGGVRVAQLEPSLGLREG